MSTLSPRKRSHSESESSSDDDDFGPALPTATDTQGPARKKRRKLPFEKIYVSALPTGLRYSKSLMHKDQLFSVHVAAEPVGFVITTSVDGVVKFWKKLAAGSSDGRSGIEFVREFKVHEQELLVGTGLSCDGALFVSAGHDGRCCIFDVVTFDLVATVEVKVDSEAGRSVACVCWVHRRGAPALLAVGVGKEVRLYDGRGERKDSLLHTLANLHRADVVCMGYNAAYDCVVSTDANGMVEYWSPANAPEVDKPDGLFEMKSSTDLFDFKKSKPKSVPCCLSMSPRGDQWATWSFPDRRVRVFDFKSGKMLRSYDESIDTLMGMQQAGTAVAKLDETDFGRRLGVERELDSAAVRSRINVCFDESGNFVCYGSLYGIKVVNTTTNKVMRLYGKDEPFRALNVAMYQGAPEQKGVVTVSMAASSNPLLEAAEERDPMLFATGYAKVRFYMFTNEDSIDKSNRDVQNEKPKGAGGMKREAAKVQLGSSAVLHTTYGDIFVRLFPDKAPKAVENFVTHARNGYYNNTIFHRVIRKFMIQGGDPLGNGTGGQSIWGKEFEDEFSNLKHDKPYTLSMANAGPGTNGSQFFITTEKTPWLDGKHTIFGRAYQGMDVVHQIENARVVKEKPEDDIKIVNISIG